MWFLRVAGLPLFIVLCVGCGKPPARTLGQVVQPPPRDEPSLPELFGLEKLAGYYDLSEMNGEIGYAGYLRVVAEGDLIGYEVHPLLGALNPSPEYSVLTPASQTTQREESDQIVQSYQSAERTASVHYQRIGKKVIVESKVCTPGLCEPMTWVAVTPD